MRYIAALIFVLLPSIALAQMCPSSQLLSGLPGNAPSGFTCHVIDAAGCEFDTSVKGGGSTSCWVAKTHDRGWVAEGAPPLALDEAQAAIGSPPVVCGNKTEGTKFIATNCNASCTVSGTCTAGGSTHCEMRCNGSSYVETGL